MRFGQLSEEANARLLGHLNLYLMDCSPQFREDVTYAIRFASPLRERTYLVRLAAEISGVDWPIAEPFAFAAELFMASALTADDVIDGAPERSGNPTLMVKAGPARAYLVAEYLHTVAHETLCERIPTVPEATWQEAANEFRSAFRGLLYHQHLESSLEGDLSVTVEQIDQLARGRTGRLVEACLKAPAILSGSDVLKTALGECGLWLGMAFQHRDDILDFICSPEIAGKPILLDLLNGQPNLVLSHVFTQASVTEDAAALKDYFGRLRKTPRQPGNYEDIQNIVVEILRSTESLLFARSRVQEYCSNASYAIQSIDSSNAKNELLTFSKLIASVDMPWEKE